MFKTPSETRRSLRELLTLLQGTESVDILVCPPFPALPVAGELLRGTSVGLGAQNVHWADEGAHTGEVSAKMLLDCGCQFVIIGHSERRQSFQESDDLLRRKLEKVVSTPLQPILCVGESLKERECGAAEDVVAAQLSRDLGGLTVEQADRILVAYEPVWAIGTGKTATPEMAQQMHRAIRDRLAGKYTESLAERMRVLYGGSVKPENAAELMSQPDINGALVGGASLDPQIFVKIIRSCGV